MLTRFLVVLGWYSAGVSDQLEILVSQIVSGVIALFASWCISF